MSDGQKTIWVSHLMMRLQDWHFLAALVIFMKENVGISAAL